MQLPSKLAPPPPKKKKLPAEKEGDLRGATAPQHSKIPGKTLLLPATERSQNILAPGLLSKRSPEKLQGIYSHHSGWTLMHLMHGKISGSHRAGATDTPGIGLCPLNQKSYYATLR